MIGKKIFLCCGLIFSLGITACSSGSSTDNPPGPGGDDDPPVADEYQVSKEYWTENITLGGYLGVNSNLTFKVSGTNGEGNAMNGSLANDNGKLHVILEGSSEFYLDTLASGGYDIYGEEDGEWEKVTVAKEYAESMFNIMSIFLPSFEYDLFKYDATTHSYQSDSFGNALFVFSAITVKFSDSKLASMDFTLKTKEEQNAEAQLNVTTTDWGKTKVTLPEVGGGSVIPEVIEVESVSLNYQSLELHLGDDPVQLMATVLPENATDKTVTWRSSNDEVVSVNQEGVITAKALGEATVYAIAGRQTASCYVQVKEKGGDEPPVVEVTEIKLDKTEIVLEPNGATVQLNATVLPDNATNKTITWKSGNVKVATVENGLVTSVNNGQTVIYAACGKVTASCNVTVKSQGGSEVIEVSQIRLDKRELTIDVKDDPVQLVATVLPENATDKTVSWTSSDSAVASVSKSGLVTAVNKGTATITATAGKASATCSVTVTDSLEPPVEQKVYYGVTLTFAYPYEMACYGDASVYTGEWLNEYLHTISVSLFADGIKIGNEVANASFELVARNADGTINYVYFGKYNVSSEDKAIELNPTALYIGKTGKYYHEDNMYKARNQEIVTINNIYYDLDGAPEFRYEMPTYITRQGCGLQGDPDIIYKGSVVFKKDNENPTHLTGLPEDLGDDFNIDSLENSLFEFTSVTCESESFDARTTSPLYQGSMVSIFEDGYTELQILHTFNGEQMVDCEFVYVGYVSLSDSDKGVLTGDDIYYIDYVVSGFYYEGEFTSEPLTMVLAYDQSKNEIIVIGYYDGSPLYVHYGLKEGTIPSQYVPTLPDKWDSSLLAVYMKGLGYTDMLPKLDNVKTFTIEESNPTSGTLVIVAVMASKNTGMREATNYTSTLSGDYGFEWNITDDYQIYYLSPNGQYELRTNIVTGEDGYTALSLVLTRHEIAYPTTDIANYMGEKGYTDPVPEFKDDLCTSYSFSYTLIMCYLPANTEESELTRIQDKFVALLVEAQYTARQGGGYTYYISPNEQFALRVIGSVSSSYGYVGVNFSSIDKIPYDEYPSDVVSGYLKGTTDPCINFNNDNADYYDVRPPFYYDYQYYMNLYVPLLNETKGTEVVDRWVSQLKELGYVQYEYVSVYKSADNDDDVCTLMSVYVSPNKQIGIYMYGSDPVTYDGSVLRGSYNVDIINLTNFENVYFSSEHDHEKYVVGLDVLEYTETWNEGDEFIFDGYVYLVYSDGSTSYLEDVVNVTAPEMVAGQQRVVITYQYDEETLLRCEYDITVLAKEAQKVEYTYANENDWDIFDGHAEFMIWAWGGEYGTGQWVEIKSINKETKEFVFSLYENCDGFKIVRLNPNNMPADIYVWDETTIAWNQTGNLTPSLDNVGSIIPFSF